MIKKHHFRFIALSVFVGIVLTVSLCGCGQGEDASGSGGEDIVNITLQQGEDQILDTGDLDGDVTWKSKDKSIATIDKNGRLIAGKPGETEIVVKGGGKTYRYKVRIEEPKKKETKATGKDKAKKETTGKDKPEKETTAKTKSAAGAAAEQSTQPILQVGSASAKPGDSNVVVKIAVKNNPGILGMLLTLSYDDQALTLQKASNGKAVREVLTLTKPGTLQSGCRFLWDGLELPEEQIADGTILTLTFDVSPSAKAGEYPISLSYDDGDIIDASVAPLRIGVVNGSIKVR